MKQNHLVLLVVAALVAALAWIAATSLTGRDRRAPSLPETSHVARPASGVLRNGSATGPDSATTPGAPASETAVTRTASAVDTPRDAVLALPATAAESGAGPRVRGRVVAQDGTPLAGAVVTLERVHEGMRTELATAESAGDGTFACPIALADADPLTLVAIAGADGFQPQRQERTFAPAGDPGVEPVLEIDFVLEPGGEVRGRIVDPDGRPRGGAEVALVVRSQAPGGPRPNLVRRTESRADGSFRLGFLSSGTYELHARLDPVGSALAGELSLASGPAHEHGDVALVGPGVLSGHALFPGGTPLAGLELWAVPEELAPIKNAVARARAGTLERERGLGLTSAATRTDADGAFRFEGLADGRYALRVEDPDVRLVPERGVFETGGEPIRLTVDTHRLEVRVIDARGRPFKGATVTVTQMSRRGADELVPGRTRRLDTGADGALSFDIVPETPFAVRVRAEGHHAADELVVLEAGRREIELEVALSDRVSGGFLRPDVRAADGEPVEGSRVWVLAEATQLALPGFDGVAVGEDGTLGPLSPGRYGLVVWPRGTAGMDFPAETASAVEVFEGRETLVPLTLPRGGRVRLTLTLPPGVSVDDELPPESETWGEITLRRRAQRHLRDHGAQVRLVSDDGEERALHFEAPGGLELVMLPGTTASVHDLLRPGRYTLRIEAPGFAPLDEPVQVRAGLVTEVAAQLAPPADLR